MKPRVSVAIGVYNPTESALKATLDSVIAQKFQDWEMVIVNDGSNERIRNILHDYADIDKRIRVLDNEKNIGLTKSLIRCMGECKGDCIFRIDAGDICRPDRMRAQLDIMESNPDIGIVGSNAVMNFTCDGELLSSYESQYPESDSMIRKSLRKKNPFCHVSVTFRRSSYDEVGGYAQRWTTSQDFDLWIRMLSVSKGRNIQETLVTVNTDYNNSISIQRNKTQCRNNIGIRWNNWRKGFIPASVAFPGIIKYSILLLLPTKIIWAVRNKLKEFLANSKN
ncbi:MAG TPA: glycosyltransferase [bacterium]|nr:glycosyltransferase [bacterium]